MPKVKIEKTLKMQAKELFDTVNDVLTHDKEVKALEPNLSLETSETDKGVEGQIKGSRISGNFEITEDSDGASTINIVLSLPLMLSPFKAVVEKRLQDKLNSIG